jgi:transcriptional regulator with XRE-family HTH domain
VGEVLRARREQLGLTLEQVHAQLRIPVHWLRAIEEEQFDAFDAAQYAKGFVRSYAQFLGLEAEPLVQAVAVRVGPRGKPQLVAPSGEVPIRPVAPPSRWRRALGWAALVGVVAFLWLAYVGYRQLRAFYATEPVPNPQPPAPALTPVPPGEQPQPGHSPPLPPAAMAGEPVVRVALVAEDVSWLRVVADGRRVFEGFIRAGERREWEATTSLQLVIGNAGGVRVQVNGRDLGLLGAPGEVVRRTFTPPPR